MIIYIFLKKVLRIGIPTSNSYIRLQSYGVNGITVNVYKSKDKK